MAVIDEVAFDYTQPLAALLKQATSEAHERVEHSPGAGWLARGELDKDEYTRFLMMLYHVYNTLENALEKHSTHPALSPTYNPTLLARAPALSADIAVLLDVAEASWQDHPMHKALLATPPVPMTNYVSRIKYLSEEGSDPSLLLAHSYVRYLGDLSGGQVIRRRVTKAYGLDENGRGTQFYDFKQLGGSKTASVGDMRKVKDWFREGMNAAGGNDASRKQAIADEASTVFELNEGLFSVLKAPSHPSSTAPEAPPLGIPASTPSPPPTPPHKAQSFVVASAPESEEKAYPLVSILSVVLAVGIAHFALVVGGFTGSAGYAKLEAVQTWLEGLFS